MKTLLLVRHAKSSWSDPTLTDRIRPLADRGKRDVITMGQRLADRQVKPDLIVTSPAVRAAETARAIAKQIEYKHKNIQLNDGLYACQPDYLLETVKAFDNELDYVMLVGHNPELNGFVYYFTDTIEHMPTCAMAEFSFNVNSWSDINRDTLQGIFYDYPKNKVEQ